MKYPRRARLIEDETWALIDGWYWCPESRIAPRIEKYRLTYESVASQVVTKRKAELARWNKWCKTQYHPGGRLAHKCTDGIPRAVYMQYWRDKHNSLFLAASCTVCNVKLTEGMKTIIIMELEF